MFSTIATISSSITTQIIEIFTGVSSLIVKHLFNDTSNSADSQYTTLTLANTNGFFTDGSTKTLNSTGTTINNHISNYITFTPATAPGLTIMFRMKLTTIITYTSNFNKYVIVQSKSEVVEDYYWFIALFNSSGNIPALWFQYPIAAISGAGNNKLTNFAISIPSANMANDNTYHHYAFTIKPVDVTGNTMYFKAYKNGTLISSSTVGNVNANYFSNLLNMKRVAFFPPSYQIVGSPSTWNLTPATCRIADFRMYSKELTSAEINTCKNGGEISA